MFHVRNTLQGINISHLGKRKIVFKMQFLGDMLIPWRVFTQPFPLANSSPRFTRFFLQVKKSVKIRGIWDQGIGRCLTGLGFFGEVAFGTQQDRCDGRTGLGLGSVGRMLNVGNVCKEATWRKTSQVRVIGEMWIHDRQYTSTIFNLAPENWPSPKRKVVLHRECESWK